MCSQLRQPFAGDVLVTCAGVQAEAEDEHAGTGVGEWPQFLVLLLPRCVPDGEAVLHPVHRLIVGSVVEHGRHILRGEVSSSVRDEEAGLPHSAVSDHCHLYGLARRGAHGHSVVRHREGDWGG